jgi:hypothetical protein
VRERRRRIMLENRNKQDIRRSTRGWCKIYKIPVRRSGHVGRMQTEGMPNQIAKVTVEGIRKRGGPCGWRDKV